MHKKVQVVILAKGPRPSVLLLKLNPKRGGFWQNVTGSVDKGEKFKEAAPRELWEETGIKNAEVTSLKFVFEFTDRFNRNVKEKCYVAVVEDTNTPVIISGEHQDYRWQELKTMTAEDYGHPSSFEVFQRAREIANV